MPNIEIAGFLSKNSTSDYQFSLGSIQNTSSVTFMAKYTSEGSLVFSRTIGPRTSLLLEVDNFFIDISYDYTSGRTLIAGTSSTGLDIYDANNKKTTIQEVVLIFYHFLLWD